MSPINVSIDFSALAELIVNAIISGLSTLFSPLPATFEEWMWTSLQKILSAQGANNLLTHAPTEYTSNNADVLLLWRALLPAEVGLAAIVLTIQGYRVIHGHVDMVDAVLRTGFFMIAGEAMPVWSSLILNAANAASDFVGSAPMDIRSELMPNDLVQGAMLIIGGFFGVLTWLKGGVGTVFIAVLIVLSPFFLVLSALPIFEGLGKWWVEEFTTWVLRGFMVALVLRLGLGLGLVFTGGLQFLFVIIAFWLAWTMDTRIRRFSVGAWGSIGQLNLFSKGSVAIANALGIETK